MQPLCPATAWLFGAPTTSCPLPPSCRPHGQREAWLVFSWCRPRCSAACPCRQRAGEWPDFTSTGEPGWPHTSGPAAVCTGPGAQPVMPPRAGADGRQEPRPVETRLQAGLPGPRHRCSQKPWGRKGGGSWCPIHRPTCKPRSLTSPSVAK